MKISFVDMLHLKALTRCTLVNDSGASDHGRYFCGSSLQPFTSLRCSQKPEDTILPNEGHVRKQPHHKRAGKNKHEGKRKHGGENKQRDNKGDSPKSVASVTAKKQV